MASTLVCLMCLMPVLHAAEPVPEYKLKAAFIYNFALFTEWPENGAGAGEPLNICLNIDSPLRSAMEEFHGKSIKGRQLVVRTVANIDHSRQCQIVFVGRLDRDRWPMARKAMANDSILSISDDAELGRDGVTIVMSLINERMVFDVDMSVARQAKLVLSSKLLRLARTIR